MARKAKVKKRVSKTRAAKVAASDAAKLQAATLEVQDSEEVLPFENIVLTEKQVKETLRVVVTMQGPDGKYNVPVNDFKIFRYETIKINAHGAGWNQVNDRAQYHNLGTSKCFSYGEGRFHRDGAQNTYNKDETPESEIGGYHKRHAIARYASLRSGEITKGGGGVSVTSYVKFLRDNIVSWATTNLRKKVKDFGTLPTDETECRALADTMPSLPYAALCTISENAVKEQNATRNLPAIDVELEEEDAE